MTRNKQLMELLKNATKQTAEATSVNDLLSILIPFKTFRKHYGPNAFSFAWYYLISIGALTLAVIMWYAFYLEPKLIVAAYGAFTLLSLVLPILSLYLYLLGLYYKAMIKGVSDTVFNKDLMFDNLLTENTDCTIRCQNVFLKFSDFKRGNEGHLFTIFLDGGRHETKDLSFNGVATYQYYEFRYIEVRKLHKKETRLTYYRYGILLDFPWTEDFIIITTGNINYPHSFQCASKEFNDKYKTGANSEQILARFLQPKVVLAFNETGKIFTDLWVEVRDKEMCISFSDNDTIYMPHKYKLSEPDQFEVEIARENRVEKLNKLLCFADELKRHNDSNF